MKTIDLVIRAQQGDDTAFITLFKEFEVMIYRIAFIYVRNKDDALDVVQETAYKSLKNIKQLKKPNMFKTWLTKIAINSSMDLLNKNSKNTSIEEYQNSLKLINESEDISLSLVLKDVLNGLDINERSVIVLRFYQDMSIKDISEFLQIPIGSAKSLLYRTLDKLRLILREVELYEKRFFEKTH